VDASDESLAAAIVEILTRSELSNALSQGAYAHASRFGFAKAAASLFDALFDDASSRGGEADLTGVPEAAHSPLTRV
jgi:hypothetical protein